MKKKEEISEWKLKERGTPRKEVDNEEGSSVRKERQWGLWINEIAAIDGLCKNMCDSHVNKENSTKWEYK